MKSIGLDLSLVGTGVVVLSNGKIVKQELIKSKPTGDKPIDEVKRIQKIVVDIEMILGEDIPTVATIEGMAFMARNTTALVQLAALNYMVRALLIDYRVPFIIVAPTSLKKFITGTGNAKKDVMMLEVYKRYNETFFDDNICDAFSLAMIGSLSISPKVKIPIFQQQVLDLLKKQL